jgi:hypothetical protein
VNNDPVNWIDLRGLKASEPEISAWDRSKNPKQEGSIEKVYISPVGPEQNGVKMG